MRRKVRSPLSTSSIQPSSTGAWAGSGAGVGEGVGRGVGSGGWVEAAGGGSSSGSGALADTGSVSRHTAAINAMTTLTTTIHRVGRW